jgi:hypothetical protein
MATRLYLADGAEIVAGTAPEHDTFDGMVFSPVLVPEIIRTTRAPAIAGDAATSVTGPTSGVFPSHSWVTPPFAADATISGTVTINLWALESNMNANACVGAKLYRIDKDGQIVGSGFFSAIKGTELGTTSAVQNFTGTPTSTTINKGDRLMLVVFFDDATSVTMAAGYTLTVRYGGATAGADYDSWIELTENVTFDTSAAGTIIYLTDAAGGTDPGGGSYDSKDAWTSRGSSSVTAVRATSSGTHATPGLLMTKTSGGNFIEWYTRRLAAFTLEGAIEVNLRLLHSNTGTNAAPRVEIAKTDLNGGSVVVFGTNGSRRQPGTSDAARAFLVSGDDLAIGDGDRLRIRVYIDDANPAMAAGETVTLSYSGPGSTAPGDTWIRLPATVTEFVAGQSGALGTASSTNAALLLLRKLTLGIASSAGTALAIGRRKLRAVGTASTVATAPALGRRKTAALGVAGETDAARPIVRQPLILAVSANTALPVTFRKAKTVAVAGETDTAVALARRKTLAVGVASSTNAALPITEQSSQQQAITAAVETDSALALGARKARLLGTATETDTAATITRYPGEGRVGRGHANPILRNGPQVYDASKVGPSCILQLGPRDYRQWYEAIEDTATEDDPTLPALALSTDGTTWVKQGLIDMGAAVAWENNEISPTSVVRDPQSGTFWMHYHGGNNSGPRKLGVATSSDGLTFVKNGANPILAGTGIGSSTWEEWIADNKVLPPWEGPDNLWRMLYRGIDSGGKGRFGLATSTDGITWTKYSGNPIFDLGTAGAWDDFHLMAMDWVYQGGLYRAWYVGRDQAGTARSQIGYAWSRDAITWVRGTANPVLAPISTGADADEPEDSIHVYYDTRRKQNRIVYGQYDLVGQTLRGKGEAFERKGAASFNGSSSYVTVSDEPDFDFERTQPWTKHAWIYLPSANIDGAIILKEDQAAAGVPGVGIGVSSGRLFGELRTGTQSTQALQTADLATGVWIPVTVTYDGSSTGAGIKLYAGGALITGRTTVGSASISTSVLNAAPLRVGARSTSPVAFFFTGRIAHPMVWNAELTAAEVAQLAKGGYVPRRDVLLPWFSLDPTDDPLTDRNPAGTAYTATPTSVTWLDGDDGPPVYYALQLPAVLGTATETDTALPITEAGGQSAVLGTASETDTARPVTVQVPQGIATETDTALPLGRRKTAALGTATETDTAGTVGVQYVRTFAVAASNKDGHTSHQSSPASGSWPPSGAVGVSTTNTLFDTYVRKVRHYTSNFMEYAQSHIIFDTSALPDGATIVDAKLEMKLHHIVVQGGEVKPLNLEWFDHGGTISTDDHAAGDVGTTAAAIAAATWQAWADESTRTITLTNPTSISKTGETGLRIGFGGGAPAAPGSGIMESQLAFYSWDHATEPQAKLIVTYTLAGGQQVTLGIAPETDSAPALGRAKRTAIGPATSTDSAPALGRLKTRPLTLAAETDTSGTLARAKVKALTLAPETDTAGTLGRAKTRALTLAASTNAALALGQQFGTSIGIAAEVDQALAITARKAKAIVLAAETDVALAVGRLKARLLTVAAEVDTAFALGRLKRKAIVVAAETDTARPITIQVAGNLGIAAEVDTAQTIGRRKAKALLLASETDTATALGRLKTRPLQIASETDAPRPVGSAGGTGTAGETDSPGVLGRLKARLLTVAPETDSAGTLGRRKLKLLGSSTETDQATGISRPGSADPSIETDSALPIVRSKRRALTLASSSNTALTVTWRKARQVVLAAETDTAMTLGARKRKALGLAFETDTAPVVRPTRIRLVTAAIETDTARPITFRKARLLGTATEFDFAFGITSGSTATSSTPGVRFGYVRQRVGPTATVSVRSTEAAVTIRSMPEGNLTRG